MKAWRVMRPGPIGDGPLDPVESDPPHAGPNEIRARVVACGVCRTDLHIAEGDLETHKPNVIPGHEVVGIVDELGPAATKFRLGDRIGIAWLRSTCGHCRYCTRSDENLCENARFTGWDEDGGYAEFAVVHEDYAYSIADNFDAEHAAPLLCAGIIGYRALRQSNLSPGGVLGIYGFGGSAHIAAQIAIYEGATVHVITRSERARQLAMELGAAGAVEAGAAIPELDSAILFAPAGELVPVALGSLARGGTLAISGVHLSRIPPLDYTRDLFLERKLVSVTANTRRDGRELISLAARIPITVRTTPFGLQDADRALLALSRGKVSGAAVLIP